MRKKPVEFLGIGRTAPDPTFVMGNHRHPLFHELIVVFRGKCHVQIAGKEILAEKGDVLFYPQGVWHAEQSHPDDPVETYYIGFKGDVGELDYQVHDRSGRIRLLISWLHEERGSNFSGAQTLNNTFLEAMLAEYVRLSGGKESNDLVLAIRTFMQDCLAEPLTLDDLARRARMSKFHFVRRYKEFTGRTPMEDLRIIRIETAKNLVMTTNLPLKSIAPRVGLCNEYYLCRLSAKYLKASLGSFRKMFYQAHPLRDDATRFRKNRPSAGVGILGRQDR
jgi:AraC-like DNA-binding protein